MLFLKWQTSLVCVFAPGRVILCLGEEIEDFSAVVEAVIEMVLFPVVEGRLDKQERVMN